MGTCKDCLHYKACKMTYLTLGGHGDDTFDEFNWVTIYGCDNFADKSEWVHLPCKVGDEVYLVTYEQVPDDDYRMSFHRERVIKKTQFDASMSYALGISVFTNREEAEKVLAARSGK